MDKENIVVETHPWKPFIPDGAKLLIMGTFPPGVHRWSMDFYYPNPTNDFWRIMSDILLGDKDILYDKANRCFDADKIIDLARKYKIALNDTGYKIRRLKGNASDKFLEILEPVDLNRLLSQMPECRDIATTGTKAAEVIANITSTQIPAMGEYVTNAGGYRIWRMPSTSRAYPMRFDQKVLFYKKMLQACEII